MHLRVAVATLLLCGCSLMDPGAITFENLRVEELTSTRAVVRFHTSQAARCEVEFGASAANFTRTATDPSMADDAYQEEHTVPLEDLVPGGYYLLRAVATNQTGTTSRSALLSISTPPRQMAGNLRNVALASAGTTVAAVSSNYGAGDLSSAYGGNNVLDGQMSTEWATNGDGNSAWIELDLGQVHSITHVGFRSRKMTDGTSIIQSFRVQFGDGAFLEPFQSPNPDTEYRFALPFTVSARRMRLEAVTTSGGNTGAKEIQLWSADP